MANQAKVEAVAALVERIKRAQSIVLVDYEGIKVKEETQLRKSLREAGGEYLVAKNRLFKIALKEAGVEDSFDDILEGTTSFAFGYDDIVAPAKIMNEVSKANAKAKIFNIKGGYLTGKRVSEAEVLQLATLPSREQLLSMVLNGMLGPVRKLAYGLVAVADKKEGSAE
ncbi:MULTISPECIES: 50S ribosomal protein L10 [Fusobacterium]|uniref:50S ribosomal protein L10 n=1 Tax=Fusobacterium TaxID=848 RepID=UPI000489DC2C|nr:MULTISPECIES: 50S ribosomal protein L10 [Fusobacterium]MCI6152982.1 50S ribosomal protein L10 [Fusobacterium perfoetens]MDY3237379.1 50S ribosomal protein L10 [Fusobacterium perfoetens]NME35962.1 50S ribosomal protein L10 [Fusobacterium sp. FSA-380-WT-3A]